MKVFRLRPEINGNVLDKCLYFKTMESADEFVDFMAMWFPSIDFEKSVFEVYEDSKSAKEQFIELLNQLQQ